MPRISLLEKAFLTRPAVRRLLIVLVHLALWSASFWLALELRFDGVIERKFAAAVPKALVALLLVRVVSFAVTKLFRGMWRYAGMPELKAIVYATTLGTLGFSLLGLMISDLRMPRSIYLGEYLASIVFVGGLRLALRVLRERASGRVDPEAVRTLIIGAGDAGESLLRDVQRSAASKWTVVGILDDDPYKHGSTLRDVPILGPADEDTLKRAIEVREVQLVVIAVPSGNGKRTRELTNLCRKLQVRAKIIPSDRIEGVQFGNLRDVAIEDLLQRDAIQLDVKQVDAFVAGRVVLVTGAGGSIGSELCRQILGFKAKKLLLLDHDENALYEIERELRGTHPGMAIEPLMGDITDVSRIEAVFSRYKPELVFHAAAHKHVPMMEANPSEAVKNNVLGTETVAKAAAKHGASAFVLISTDKAVNPTSVMGATKRVAEMIIQRIAETTETRFAAVRFGNVLGSNGSVVPLFKEQIARGGPITVTHPDVCRYFMTIPEATQLVLQAGALGGTGEIFVLDMGQPVKIVNLARDLIELSGLRPDVDIQIEFSGLRPGEKLFEELLLDGEAYGKTPHPKILVGRITPTEKAVFSTGLATLRERALEGGDGAVRTLLSEIVPEAILGKSPPIPSSIKPAPAKASGAPDARASGAPDARPEGEGKTPAAPAVLRAS